MLHPVVVVYFITGNEIPDYHVRMNNRANKTI